MVSLPGFEQVQNKFTVSILGCGWLGLPLAGSLMDQRYEVKGSTTTEIKMPVFESNKIKPYFIKIEPDNIDGDIQDFLKCDVLVINFPPKRRSQVIEHFPDQVMQLIKSIESSPVKKVLFISSTSVYPDNNSIVDESTRTLPEKDSGKALVVAENMLSNNQNFKTTIIRFAGLIGPERHPGRFLAGKTGMPGAENPVNLIHLNDCIGIVNAIIKNDCWGEIFNGCYPDHPPRKAYYRKAALQLNLKPPEFEHGLKADFKIVNGQKVQKILKYEYRHDIS